MTNENNIKFDQFSLDIRDFEPGATYFAIADASRGGRCVMNGMFIAAWTTKGEAKAAAGTNPNYTVVKCHKPETGIKTDRGPKTYFWNGNPVNLKHGADNPTCPNCGHYNAMLHDGPRNDSEDDYALKCRDCGAEVIVTGFRALNPAEAPDSSASETIRELEVQKAALVAAIERMKKMFQYIAKGEAVQAQAEQGIIEATEALLFKSGFVKRINKEIIANRGQVSTVCFYCGVTVTRGTDYPADAEDACFLGNDPGGLEPYVTDPDGYVRHASFVEECRLRDLRYTLPVGFPEA